MACGCNNSCGCNNNVEPRRPRPIDQRTCREAIRLLKEINEAIEDFFEEEDDDDCGCHNNCGCGCNNCGCRRCGCGCGTYWGR